jgi:prophage maintenance system killer protein
LLAIDGGVAAIPDDGPLQSALARPQQLRAYGDKPDLVDLATAYISGTIPSSTEISAPPLSWECYFSK